MENQIIAPDFLEKVKARMNTYSRSERDFFYSGVQYAANEYIPKIEAALSQIGVLERQLLEQKEINKDALEGNRRIEGVNEELQSQLAVSKKLLDNLYK